MTDDDSADAILRCRENLERLARGAFTLEKHPDGDSLGEAVGVLACRLRQEREKRARLDDIILRINSGLFLDEILDCIYRDFKALIPYDRIGLSFVEDEEKTVRAYWAKSDACSLKLVNSFSAPLAGSSLEEVLRTGKPRILNDLEDYLRNKPQSQSTRFIVEEGFRSSLTCPLMLSGKAVGFIFFTSLRPHTYVNVHVDDYLRVANHVSVAVEKGRLASDLAESHALLERQNGKLLKLSEVKNTFLGMATHDLRGPIGFAKMAAEQILAGGATMPAETRETRLRDIVSQSAQMLALLNDLLDISQIESGTFQLHPVSVALADFLRETVKRHARLAEPKGTRVELEPVLPGAVRADPFRLRQIMDNLISNAVKYSPPGSLVLVRAAQSAGSWQVEVQDQGPGFTTADKRQLFEDFVHLSAEPTGGEKGTGLGLAITRRMVEAHGGAIGVQSEPGYGATFHVSLPSAET